MQETTHSFSPRVSRGDTLGDYLCGKKFECRMPETRVVFQAGVDAHFSFLSIFGYELWLQKQNRDP